MCTPRQSPAMTVEISVAYWRARERKVLLLGLARGKKCSGRAQEDEILVTAGSAEANFVAAVSLVESGDLVAVDLPNYMQIPGLLGFLGARVLGSRRSHTSWRFPLEEAVGMIEEKKA